MIDVGYTLQIRKMDIQDKMAEYITNAINIRDECLEDLYNMDYDSQNYNQAVGGVLFRHAILKGDLVNAIKINKKIEEFDYDLLEKIEENDTKDCSIDGEDFKSGEFYRLVCESVKEGYDYRSKALKNMVKCLKIDGYNELREFFLHLDDFYYDDTYDEVVKAYLDLKLHEFMKFKRPTPDMIKEIGDYKKKIES